MTAASKILVVYFSKAGENYGVGKVEVGNTQLLAQEIVAQTQADEFKIEPVKQYPEGHQEAVDLATMERENQLRPEYVGDIDISPYETIFLGYPIWWGDLPMIVYTFIEKHDWQGKTVIAFNTHEGSGNAGTYKILQEKLSGATLKGNGFNMIGTTARSANGIKQLNAWLAELGFSPVASGSGTRAN